MLSEAKIIRIFHAKKLWILFRVSSSCRRLSSGHFLRHSVHLHSYTQTYKQGAQCTQVMTHTADAITLFAERTSKLTAQKAATDDSYRLGWLQSMIQTEEVAYLHTRHHIWQWSSTLVTDEQFVNTANWSIYADIIRHCQREISANSVILSMVLFELICIREESCSLELEDNIVHGYIDCICWH